jgi:hypothetical protein
LAQLDRQVELEKVLRKNFGGGIRLCNARVTSECADFLRKRTRYGLKQIAAL